MKLLPFEKNWKTINELLENRSGAFSDKVIYNFLSDGNTVSDSLTYGELHKKATIIASHLQMNCKAGDRILLLFPQDLNYIAAFFGCLYAGMIAVPAYPPRNNRNFGRIETIIEDSQAAAALLNTTIENRIKRILPDSPLFRRLKLLNTDLLTETASRLTPVSLTEESIAFLQYTSGSTSDPKGVMVTHGNLIENQEMIRRLFGQTSDSIILGWLPLYHDMGLIGNVLQPLYVNAECYLMTPAEFIQNPFVWLKAISTYRATTSGGPNFAYELCLKRIKEDELSDLDLSCWKVAFNGAEPIRAATMQHFADVFKQAGFDKKAFVPCYGLAEATLLVSAGSKGEDYLKAFDSNSLERHRVAEAEQNSDAKLLVNCGEIADGIELEIVNPETFERAKENEIGEVWITGASVAKGYWNRKKETEETFHAKLKTDNGLQYLRTGDLGFLDHTNLFITGRIKDLIILNGRNLYPQDIEKSVEQSHPALRKEAGIAFGNVTENGEKLIIVHELEPRGKYAAQEIFSNIQKVLAAEFEISAGEIVLVKAGTLPKTSSGKKQRNACRTEFLNDNLEIVEKLDSENGSTAGFSSDEVFTNLSTDDFGKFKFELQKLTAKILKINALQLNEKVSLLSFGLDSLTALELTHSIRQQFKIELPVGDLLEETDFGAICKILWELKSESESEPEEFQKAGETKDRILSAGQKSLWFLQQLAPENTAYHLNFPAVIKNDDFDAERLKQAFEKIALTHDSLRSTFFVKNGEPFRKIHDLPLIEWQENDFSNLSKNEIKELIKLEFQKPFDLVKGPLLRIGLWKTGNGEILLSLSIHHIIADFWSLALIVKQLGEFYNRAGNETIENPETLNNYEQFVFEENKYLESDAGKNAGLFWRKQLSGELPVLDLPFDFPRPPMQTFNGEISHFKIDTALVEKLKKLSVEHETTLFTTLLTAYKILLHRYTNQSDIVVGTPTSGRKNYEYKNLVGYFVNPVAVRSFPETRLSFAEYLDNVKKTFLEVLKNQNYPFLRVVENVTQTVDPSRSPVFQTMFILQQSPLGDLPDLAKWAQGKSSVELNLGKLKLESVEIEQTYSQFDLSMMVAEHAGEFSAAIQYNSDLFKRQTVARIGRNFNKLLKSIVENPHKSIAELDLLSAEEYEKVVFEWNNTNGTYDQNGLIHKLFEKQAEKFPQKIALSVGNTSLTYRELNEQANRFAGFLRKRGVTNEDRIAVYLNRSEKLIIALLGILKSGAAYVPLDIAYPKNRLSLMLEDSQSKFVITESLLASVPVSTAEVINIDEMRDDFQEFGRENLETALNSRNLAYIIYTSGSTGKPKGVAIEHRNVCALIAWAETIFSIGETKKVLASTSICFDLSVFEIFFTLSRGGEICLVENALELINSENISGITLINTVPSAMTELCRSNKIPETVETVNLAGEPLLNHLVEKVYSNKQVKRLYNLYGPSEDTTYSTFALMPDGQRVNSLIGKPICNTQVYLLNEKLMPVPIGAAGEIYLGGDGVTRGYFNRSEITAEKFIPDNLSGKSGARLYKTNDLARFSENGDLIFLGRSDHQVKIRGYRIEPGEIETRIGLHPSVKETIVTAYTKNVEEKYIVGYIVPNEGLEISKSEIKTYLAEHLPEYMIPSVIVFLDSLPLTPNGKIDRKSLPIPAVFDENSRENYTPPRTPVEEVVVKQIAEILGRREIGIYSNFFENGGHSLSATQLAYRLRQIFQTEIPLKTIFEKPDAAGLAAFIGQTLLSGKKIKSSRIEKIIDRKPLRLSSAQKKLWFIEQIRPLSAAYNVSGAMRLEGNLDIKALQNAFEIIINRHDSLRTRFIEIEGEPFQIIEDIRHLNLEIEDRRHAKNDLDSEIKAEACRGFDLNAGKLIRVRLWRTGKNEYVLLLVMHHIITDGWSLGVLVKEIKREYERQIDGGKSSAEEIDENKILQYGDFAEWQISRMEIGELSPHIEFWQKKLDGVNSSLELPTDYIRPAEPTFRGAKIPLKISNQTVAELKKIEQSEGVTLFMILLSALNILLSRYSGETDICIGVPVANRLHPETENIIGFFVNSLVIRTRLGTNETVESLIQKTRKNAIEAYSHQELPFDVLVENLPVAREISRNPIFQIAFALQNTPAESLSLPGVKCTAIEVDTESSKFDLTFDLKETENGLEGYLEYSTDIFSEPTITQMAKHFVRITKLIGENLSSPVNKIPVLSNDEISQLKIIPNTEQSEYPSKLSLPEIFSNIAEENPSATALIGENVQLTYKELDEQSNVLANYLLQKNITEGDCVGVGISRSPELIISILGILKAGCVYVPVEPSFPIERIKYILNDTGTRLVLTANSEIGNSENQLGANIEDVGAILNSENLSKSAPGIKTISPESTAYIMYTSGSTGQPKGVCVTHRNIARLVKNQNYVNLDENEIILQLAPTSFDASTFEIWGALLNGGRLVLMPNGFSTAEDIGRTIKKYEITTLWLTAGLFHLMVDEELEALINLKQLLAGGDVLSTAHVNKFLEKANGKCRLINGYGPTENTTFTACFPMTDPVKHRSIPIGKSISNTQIYIVDENLDLVPKGVVGELITGGDGVSNGYLNQPRLTAKSFVPDPFSGKTGGRLYRTGDLARLLPDGTIEFVGRKDEQIKISGYRIEPGEIESVFRLYPQITQAVITVGKNGFGEKNLSAFIKTADNNEPDTDELKSFLRKQLPAYMIPAKITVVGEFPLNTNGKVDKKALARLENSAISNGYQAPQTKFEIDIAEIWKKLLVKNEIGIDDDFFELGGHSLLATRLAAAIKKDFSMEIPIIKIFENPTIRRQAKIVSEQKNYRVTVAKNKPIKAIRRGRKNIESLLTEADEIAHSTENPS